MSQDELNDPLLAHERAQKVFARVLAGVRSDQLDASTPCDEWNVLDVVNHVIAGNCRMASAPIQQESELPALIAAHAASGSAAQAAFAAPGGLDRDLQTTIGPIPARMMIGIRTADLMTHAWDIARATGQPRDLDPELAEHLVGIARQVIRPNMRGAGKPFGEEQPCDEAAPAMDRLAAVTGRRLDS